MEVNPCMNYNMHFLASQTHRVIQKMWYVAIVCSIDRKCCIVLVKVKIEQVCAACLIVFLASLFCLFIRDNFTNVLWHKLTLWECLHCLDSPTSAIAGTKDTQWNLSPSLNNSIEAARVTKAWSIAFVNGPTRLNLDISALIVSYFRVHSVWTTLRASETGFTAIATGSSGYVNLHIATVHIILTDICEVGRDWWLVNCVFNVYTWFFAINLLVELFFPLSKQLCVLGTRRKNLARRGWQNRMIFQKAICCMC